ncbi:MAG: hypothetical protein ACK4FW_04970 [Stenotrophomonas sp.]
MWELMGQFASLLADQIGHLFARRSVRVLLVVIVVVGIGCTLLVHS